MLAVLQFLEKRRSKVEDIFAKLSKDEELPATSIFTFLREIFQNEPIKLVKDAKDYFADDQNQSHTERRIQQYYKTTAEGKSGKFYLYRINFQYQEIQQYLSFWLSNDPDVTVYDPSFNQPMANQQPIMNQQATTGNATVPFSQQRKGEIVIVQNLRESSMHENQFLAVEQRVPMLFQTYKKQIEKYQDQLLRAVQGSEEAMQLKNNILSLKNKLQQIQQKIKKSSENESAQHKDTSKNKTVSPNKSKTETTKKKDVNLKLLFDFYAKQNHLTGVKASFQRIQHQSQTINYQKLVHFLKEYDIFPQKSKDQKKLHNLYVRVCSNTRDLHYPDFLQFLEKYPQIIIQTESAGMTKKETMINKIQSKNQKNKLLHNPFHSLEKHDFRIDPENIKYEFKLKPLKGKLIQEVTSELESRKKQKEEAKQMFSKEKEEKQFKKLKKLMAIDPYHPLVLKNSGILQERSISMLEPVANLDNMQKFRDANFDMKAKFGIADFDDDPLKQMSNRYDVDKRVQLMEREESQRMSNLMSGLIERSQAKLAKLGLSPRKRQGSSKLN